MDIENEIVTEKDVIKIIYTNYRGEKDERIIKPISIWFGSTEWHPDEQWLLHAYDLEKNAERDFAMKDIERWAK